MSRAAEDRLLILGAGRFAFEVFDIISQAGGFEVEGFIQNVAPPDPEARLEGMPVYSVEQIEPMVDSHVAFCAIGSPKRRAFIEQVEAMGMRFATVVHPSAVVSPRSKIGAGTLIGAGCVVGAGTSIGRHVIVNRGSLIGHHTEVGDLVTMGPGVNVAGAVRIGTGAAVGMGAMVKDHLEIGEQAIIGMGAVVRENVPDGKMVVAARTVSR